MESGLGERVSSVETTVNYHGKEIEKHDKRIEKIEDTTLILNRVELILEQQVEMNKEQHKTLSVINDNLTNLNASQVQMQEEMKTMNSRIQKVEQIQAEDNDRYTFNLKGLPKKSILKALGIGFSVLTAVVTAWVLVTLKLK